MIFDEKQPFRQMFFSSLIYQSVWTAWVPAWKDVFPENNASFSHYLPQKS
jgi:hypothetical protein